MNLSQFPSCLPLHPQKLKGNPIAVDELVIQPPQALPLFVIRLGRVQSNSKIVFFLFIDDLPWPFPPKFNFIKGQPSATSLSSTLASIPSSPANSVGNHFFLFFYHSCCFRIFLNHLPLISKTTTTASSGITKTEFLKLDPEGVIKVLKEIGEIRISTKVERIIQDQEIDGMALTNLTQEKLELAVIPMGPAANIIVHYKNDFFVSYR